MKSTLKTFLAGKNPYSKCQLDNSTLLALAVTEEEKPLVIRDMIQFFPDGEWYCDVLDDGTAITYSPQE